MNILSFLATISFVVYLYLGFHALKLDIKLPANRIFFLVCLCIALWTFCAIFAFSSDTKEEFLFWFTLGTIPNIVFYPMALHFSLVLTRLVPLRPLVYAAMYLPALPIYYRTFTEHILFKDFVKTGNYWEFLPDYGSFWLMYVVAYYFICMAAGAICLVVWSRRAKTNKERSQGRIIFIAMLISIIIITADEIILSKLSGYRSRAMSPIFYLFWMGGIWYAIARYQFLKISPAAVSECIVAAIDESFLLLDNNFNIVRINRAAEELLKTRHQSLVNRSFSEIIEESRDIAREMERMRDGAFESFSCRLHYRVLDGPPLLVDTKLKIVRDDHRDSIGVLVIGKEVKELRRLRDRHHLSPREADVINLIIQGNSRKDIANMLGLSNETVKTHCTSAYNKLGVGNKIQLINVLKEYNLISGQQADVTVVPLK
ncbi:MAG TPA: histidine kinase N-terminal 7TM domain-containing protein [Spirochaetota bacterium]|nr:histidine kinase N-terminal 7TM domain-containing protein [Spirochaetota bacterium]HQQ87848.1 histidine kinase N-terminal 7TM domain-containing protein [Smithellaceae bacterium]